VEMIELRDIDSGEICGGDVYYAGVISKAAANGPTYAVWIRLLGVGDGDNASIRGFSPVRNFGRVDKHHCIHSFGVVGEAPIVKACDFFGEGGHPTGGVFTFTDMAVLL